MSNKSDEGESSVRHGHLFVRVRSTVGELTDSTFRTNFEAHDASTNADKRLEERQMKEA